MERITTDSNVGEPVLCCWLVLSNECLHVSAKGLDIKHATFISLCIILYG